LPNDLRINGIAEPGCREIMIWSENFKQVAGGRYVQDMTFDGRTYQVYKRSGSGYIASVATAHFTSGTVNLLDIMEWVIAKGWLSDKWPAEPRLLRLLSRRESVKSAASEVRHRDCEV